ncbi:uncharacterized protein LTR77_007563 [Saxophila tyrrhenica]|uniref:NAD(P)-binding domain-containing protein n=1 Tax=Saxophila tyrrhenica TaxID=1690608 RepID=A0AAV9P2E8_9PEZI|nr:hypothetical protein LTR77_007563 [Saxophila tyrrhenica]
MPLQITVLPASTQAGRETIRSLLAEGEPPLIQAVYRDVSKAPSEFTSHADFKAVKGDVSSGTGLDFSTSDAVFYIPPPTYDGTDSSEFGRNAANNVKAALETASGVKRIVLLSAMGAQNDKGVGILSINHVTDETLKTSAAEVVVVKPGFFMETWVSALDTAKADTPYFDSYITPDDHEIAVVSLDDIGKVCAQQLLDTGNSLPSSPYSVNLRGPRDYSALDVQSALQEVTGKKVKINAIKPDQLPAFFGQHVPAQYADELAEMTAACLPGGLIAKEMVQEEGVARGQIELVEVLRKAAESDLGRERSGAF